MGSASQPASQADGVRNGWMGGVWGVRDRGIGDFGCEIEGMGRAVVEDFRIAAKKVISLPEYPVYLSFFRLTTTYSKIPQRGGWAGRSDPATWGSFRCDPWFLGKRWVDGRKSNKV